MPITWPAGASPPGMIPSTVKRIKFPKSPDDITPVTCDFTGALQAIDNDTLQPNFIPRAVVLRNDGNSPDLYAIGTPFLSDDKTRVTVWLAAGTVGFEYLVSVTVMSIDGQEFTRSFIMPCNLR